MDKSAVAIAAVLVLSTEQGYAIDLSVPEEKIDRSRMARRSLEGRTGCGCRPGLLLQMVSLAAILFFLPLAHDAGAENGNLAHYEGGLGHGCDSLMPAIIPARTQQTP